MAALVPWPGAVVGRTGTVSYGEGIRWDPGNPVANAAMVALATNIMALQCALRACRARGQAAYQVMLPVLWAGGDGRRGASGRQGDDGGAAAEAAASGSRGGHDVPLC